MLPQHSPQTNNNSNRPTPQKPQTASTQAAQKPPSTSHRRSESNESRTTAVRASSRTSASPLLHNASLSGQSSRSATPVQGQRSRSSLATSEVRSLSDFQDFTQDDYDYFYKLAPSIQNTSVDKYARFWRTIKSMRPTIRSADDWQEYYERVVMPVWKKEAAHLFKGSSQSTSSADPSPQITQTSAPIVNTSGLAISGGPSGKTSKDAEMPSPTPTCMTNPVVVIESPKKPSHLSPGTLEGTKSTSKSPASNTRASPMPSQRAGNLGETTSTDRAHRVPTPASPNPKRKMSPVASASPSKRLRTGQNRVRLTESPAPAKNVGKKVEFVDQVDPDKGPATTPIVQKQTTPFDIYESHGFPEGEKENFMINGSGSPTLPARHIHIKSEEALEVFTDPPGEFLLQAPHHDDDDDAEIDEDSWQDIDDLEAASQRMINADAHDEALDAAQHAADEAEDEVFHSATAQAAIETDPDPEILDELRSEYETRHDFDDIDEDPQEAPVDDQHTQALLNAATQVPDLDLPLPRDDQPVEDFEEVEYPVLPNDDVAPEEHAQAEDDIRDVQYPHLPSMSQEDEDVEEAEEANEIDENESEYDEPDLDVPPPLEASEMPPEEKNDNDDDNEGLPTFESQIYSQPVKSVYSTLRREEFPGRPSSTMTRQPVSSPPASSPPRPDSRTQERGKPLNGTSHPTVSGITIKRELREAPQFAEGMSSPRSQYSHASGSTAAWVAQTPYTNSSPSQPFKLGDHLNATFSRPSPVAAKQSGPQAGSSPTTATRVMQRTHPSSSTMLLDSGGYQRQSSSPSTARIPQTMTQYGSSPPQALRSQNALQAHDPKPAATRHSQPQPRDSTAHSPSNTTTHRVSASTEPLPIPPTSIHPASSTMPPSTSAPSGPTTLETFMKNNLAAGHPQSRIITSLQRASMNMTLARRVLKSLALGRGVPNDVRGIWTEKDDEVMRGGAASEMAALERFQGIEAYRKRREMLTRWGMI